MNQDMWTQTQYDQLLNDGLYRDRNGGTSKQQTGTGHWLTTDYKHLAYTYAADCLIMIALLHAKGCSQHVK